MSSSFGNQYSGFGHKTPSLRYLLAYLRIDLPLLFILSLILGFSLVVLYSTTGPTLSTVSSQASRILLGFIVMWLVALVPPQSLKRYTPVVFFICVQLLIIVMFFGATAKGGQRWIELGVFRFQPSELFKVVVPMAVAWLVAGQGLPIRWKQFLISLVLISVPFGLVVGQPDLGTALMIALAGIITLVLAGLRWQIIVSGMAVLVVAVIIIQQPQVLDELVNRGYLKEYQKTRILTLFSEGDEQTEARGTHWQSDQSAIAIGSGGLQGKGYQQGTQAKHGFLPEAHTDFVFAGLNEEFGMTGALLLLFFYLLIFFRSLVIATSAQDTFSRLVAGTFAVMLMLNVCVNTLMVSGLLPVVGIPLPLFSYGGTSVVSTLAGFGMLMSIHSHRKTS